MCKLQIIQHDDGTCLCERFGDQYGCGDGYTHCRGTVGSTHTLNVWWSQWVGFWTWFAKDLEWARSLPRG